MVLAGCGGPPEEEELCGPLHPEGLCADGFRCHGGSCFAESEFCSPSNIDGICPPSQQCTAGECVAPSTLCSPANPTGMCEAGQTCRAGQCIANELLCSASAPEGLCPTEESCIDGTCRPQDELCSSTNTSGLCPTPLECLGGVCSTDQPCSPTEPQGFCSTGLVCIDGACVEQSDACSPTNPTGQCPTGRSCLDGTCVMDAQTCSPTQPAGVCPTGQTCLDGSCTANSTLCSASNPTGECPTGRSCVDGVCVGNSTLCSSTNPSGDCPDDEVCIGGSCVGPECSTANPSGTCPPDEQCISGSCMPMMTGSCECLPSETCVDGVCRQPELLCSISNPTGLCQSGFDCIAGTCIDAGAGCSSTNHSGICPMGQICDAGTCEAIDDTALCNDNNPCTRDLFDYARNRCVHEAQTASCTDGNACTNDTCVAGTCQASPISGCIAPPALNPYVTPTNNPVLNLGGTKPAGSSIEINGSVAVSENPETTWMVTLNLAPGENVYRVNSRSSGTASATVEVRVVYDITAPTTLLTPAGGVFLNGVTVRVASNEPATVYYTTDGATPDEFSASFQSVKEFRVFDDTTLRFRARDTAGNWETAVVTASYEITSDANGWSAGPSLTGNLIHAGATTINQNVYVVGGSSGLAPQAGAFAYSSTAGWTALASLADGRAQLSLAAVGNRLFAIGGERDTVPSARVEILDTSATSPTWTMGAPMLTSRYGLVAVPHGNRIFVFGGRTNGPAVLNVVEVYDPSANSWSNSVAQMPRARYAFGAVSHGGRIYLVGGEDVSGAPIAEVDIYEPDMNRWTTGAPMPTPRSFVAAGLQRNLGAVNGGYTGVVVAGGRLAGGASTAIVEEYIIEDNVWRQRTPLDLPRHGAASVSTSVAGTVDSVQGHVWAIGGQTTAGVTSSVVRFAQEQDYVRRLAPMPAGRFQHAAGALNGRIYLFGGRNFQEEQTLWAFDPETETYAELMDLPSAQNGLSGIVVGDFVYALGGADQFGNSVAHVRAFDPVEGSWANRAPMLSARRDAAVAAIGHEIYVIGGYSDGALQTVEIYDTRTNMWRSGPALPEARTGAMAVAHRGDIYLIGGVGAAGTTVSTIRRLRAGTWSVVPGTIAASYGSAFLIGDSQINVFAGRDDGTLTNRVWSYNITSQQLWITVSIAGNRLLSPLDRSAAAYLHGKVYLFGGNANASPGPEGVPLVQKVQGRCFNGVRDGRESGGVNNADAGGGCGVAGYEHYDGLRTYFYNAFPVDQTSRDRAIDACNAYYGITSGCTNSCDSNWYTITRNGTCNCDEAPRWYYRTAAGSHAGGATRNAGDVENSPNCNVPVVGTWY
jgi:N-acetylneuraminic acid mutarotase